MHQGPRVRNSNSCEGMFSSSVGATFTWMIRSHYSSLGHRMSVPGLRRIRGHPLRSVIFQRDPDLDLRRSVLTRYMKRAGRPLHRTGLGSPQASLFSTRPPFLIFHDLPLSFICLYCWRNVLACLIPIQTPVSDRSRLEHSMLPCYLKMRDPALKLIRHTEGVEPETSV
jgi:hypothetical protein